MKWNQYSRATIALVGVMVTAALAAPVFAQQGQFQPQGGQGGPPGGPGGPGGFGPQGFGGRGGGPGAFGGRGMMMGTITGGDASANTIVVSTGFGGDQTIKVSGATKFTTSKTVTVADLKIGDQVRVQGVPSAITASSIMAGDLSALGGQGRGPSGPNGQGGQGGPGVGPGGQGGGPGGQDASAMATGKIVSTTPLTIKLSSDVTITLKLAANAKITKLVSTAYTNLKIGDRIMAGGAAADDGSFSATSIAVNVDMGGGMGGFGGRGGPGGPGGQGGPEGPGGPPPGGPGSEGGLPPPNQ